MRLSFAISLSPTKFSAISSDNWKKSLTLMKKLGFAGVELGIRDPLAVDSTDLQLTLRKNDLQLVAIGTGQAYVDEGLSLSDPNPGIRKKAVSRMKKQVDLAAQFKCYVIIGLIRGTLAGAAAERKRRINSLAGKMQELSAYAKRKKVKLLIEPLNRYETNIMNTAAETVAFIKRHKLDNCYLLLDTFHMNIEEKDLFKT
ncbi:MAG: sugar phosphate isomerase/epimerase, partial [bacterium]|nr:sugar phosphate isomerase/epimerase [bacterium]